jgi:hypothetical protein
MGDQENDVNSFFLAAIEKRLCVMAHEAVQEQYRPAIVLRGTTSAI